VDPPAVIYMGKDKEESGFCSSRTHSQLVSLYYDNAQMRILFDMDGHKMSGSTSTRPRLELFFSPVHIPERVNAIVNRLNKTKVVRDVDHEQEKVDRIKVESAKRKAAAIEKKKADAERARQREAEKAARSYDNLFTGAEDEEDEDEGGPKEKKKGIALEDDFM
ncbi:hypothetical protein FRC07_006964, partial [Ceratobasidium sp. 392]